MPVDHFIIVFQNFLTKACSLSFYVMKSVFFVKIKLTQ